MEKTNSNQKSNGHGATPFAQTYFHGTRSDLKVGEFIEVGFNSNYGQRKNAKYIFLSRQGRVLKPNNEVVETPHIADNNSIAGYIIVLAKNIDEATKIAKKCPILNGQNTCVEIRETATLGQ